MGFLWEGKGVGDCVRFPWAFGLHEVYGTGLVRRAEQAFGEGGGRTVLGRFWPSLFAR